MSNKRRVAEDNIGVFLADRGAVVVPVEGLNVGPGKPGPGDEWRVPMGPIETEGDVIPEPAHSDGTVVSPFHPTDER
jgi:hypothetical protein